MAQKPGFRWGKVLVCVLACVAASAFVLASLPTTVYRTGPVLYDVNRLRDIVGIAVVQREIPMKDGAFDPYEFVRRGDILREEYSILRSERSGTGPTDEEIERGDYTNFPWERYRGDGKLGLTFPLLWEKRPDKRGGTIVALSDGSVTYCEGADFAIRRLVGLVAQSGTLPMKDGAFDPYEFVRQGHISPHVLQAFGTGLTDQEIERGDYTNFPWERYRGDGKLEGPPFRLLWDTKPDERGRIVVGLSDGTVQRR